MAFEINPKVETSLPRSLDGLYVLPYEWFTYGLYYGYLKIESLDFYDTVQGSMFLTLQASKIAAYFKDEKSGIDIPYWFVYRSGSGIISIVCDKEVISWERHIMLVEDSHYRVPIPYMSVQALSQLKPFEQKLMNESLICLFKGSKVKLEHSVWF